MNYSKFSKQLKETVSGMEIHESLHYFKNTIQKTVDNTIIINNIPTQFKTLSEAKSYIKNKDLSETIVDSNPYTDTIKIATIIKENHNIKVTNNIIEQYIKLASDKSFTIDPVVYQIRESNIYDAIIDNKINYILEDNSNIAIDIKTQKHINTILENKPEVVDFMCKSSDNFLKILEVLIKD